jgi:hypothetical protein
VVPTCPPIDFKSKRVLESVANGAVGTVYVEPVYRATLETRRSARLPEMSVGPPTWTLAVGVKGPGMRYDAVTAFHPEELGSVAATHVIPSFEYAVAVLSDVTTNRPVVGLTVTEFQLAALGRGLVATHVIPSFEYAAVVLPRAIATNLPVVGLTVTENQSGLLGMVAATHVIPSFEYAA